MKNLEIIIHEWIGMNGWYGKHRLQICIDSQRIETQWLIQPDKFLHQWMNGIGGKQPRCTIKYSTILQNPIPALFVMLLHCDYNNSIEIDV